MLAFAAGWIAACDRSGPPHKLPSAGTVVVVVGPAGGSAGWEAFRDGAASYLAGIEPLKVEVHTPTADTPAGVAELIDRVRARKPKAALLYHAGTLFDGVVRPFREAGIMTVEVGRAAPQQAGFAYLIPDGLEAAEKLARGLMEVGDGRVTAALIWDGAAEPHERATAQRLIAAIESQHTVRILEQIDVSASGQTLAEAVSAVIQRYTNIGFVLTPTAEPWLSASAADWETWRRHNQRFRYATPRGVVELGGDLGRDRAVALGLVVDGELGAEAGRLLMDGLIGTRVWGTTRLWPCEIVTASNWPDFAQRCAEARGHP